MPSEKPNEAAIFNSARRIAASCERAAFLANACQGDAALQARVERLLSAYAEESQFLEQPAPELGATLVHPAMGEDRGPSLQAGLAVAFGSEQAVVLGDGNHSVLKMLGQTLDKMPRVALRDSVKEGADPVVRPKSAEMPQKNSDSRYQLQGEIARGGMGAILKGRDNDLGRDLAIKVLLDAHKDKPEVVQRFIEEAQIGGQLQHPGIAPIYELGQFGDKRPFFAMKLIKGETLSKLLADRADATEDRGRFLGIFEQICQTMAYAHSRGVIHRDLKPANIMVGAFGEVQVMDWGLAKVLSEGGIADEKTAHTKHKDVSIIQTMRSVGSDSPGTFGTVGSHTQMGSVMGTPAYMPPEQALGEIDNLDERADVFGLGAILCEILTGKPPYVADDGTQLFRMASRGKLEDCVGRLDRCDADAELIALAKHCLELEPADRPRDAGVLADRVSGYLQSVETRLRETELAKVDAQVRTEELRRRHQLAFKAGGAIAVSLVIGIAVSVWQAVRADRAATMAKSAEQRAVATVDELRATAPAFAEQARGLAAKEQYADAIAKLDYAIKLRPDAAEFLVAKGDLLQCQLQLAPAAAIYREALRVQPGLARAEASAKLCDELLAAQPAADGKLSRESLARLHVAMQQQQRPSAELLPVARLLGEEKKLLLDYWLARLKDLPVSAERPLAQRLNVREDGRLALDLSGTKVNDLSPLAGAPLAVLNLSGSKELTDISPLAGLALIELWLHQTGVTDLTPLREMHSLENLIINDTQVADLTPLSALRLKNLHLSASRVTDLTPLQKMPIEELNLRDTRVSDLSPLSGMPIKILILDRTPVRDFSPLAQMPLEKCYLSSSQITDLTVLRGRPLKELALNGCAQARSYAAFAEIPTLETLLLPDTFRTLPDGDLAAIGALRTHPKLRQIQAEIEGMMYSSAAESKDLFWQDWDRLQTFLPALRKSGFRFGLTKRPDGTYHLGIFSQPLSDLSFLKGAPISSLVVQNCKITDPTPLRDLPLRHLNLDNNPITDLSALRGIPLETLRLRGTAVSDLSPLAGMPLKALHLDNCRKLTDISPLLEVPTLELLLLPTEARNLDLLRKMPNLKRLDFKYLESTAGSTVEDFWKQWDALGWIRALNDTGIPYSTSEIMEKTLEGDKGTGMWSVRIVSNDFSDCSIFKGAANIQEMNLSGSAVTDLAPLADCKELISLILPPNAVDIEFLRTSARLQRISYREDPKTKQPAQTAAEFWKDYDTQGWLRALRASGLAIKSMKHLEDSTWDVDLEGSKITDLTILKGAPISRLNLTMTAVSDLTALRGCPLQRLLINSTRVADLEPLRGLPLQFLAANGTAVADLEPLRGMAIKELALHGTKVTDLRPLQGMPLEKLNLKATKVTDLSALRGMPLTTVEFLNCPDLTDLSPLAETKGLTRLILPPKAKEIEFLRTFPKLEHIGFKEHRVSRHLPDKTAAEFWTDYDANKP